jgi:hypothetical protein
LGHIDQFLEEFGVALEGGVVGLTLLTFLEAAEVEREVLAAGANVVGDQVVVGDLVAVLGMVPEPADVLDTLAMVVDEGIVNRDGAVIAVAEVRVALEDLQAAAVEAGGVGPCEGTQAACSSEWGERSSGVASGTKG